MTNVSLLPFTLKKRHLPPLILEAREKCCSISQRVPVELPELLSELTELHYLGAIKRAECTNLSIFFHKMQGGGKTK